MTQTCQKKKICDKHIFNLGSRYSTLYIIIHYLESALICAMCLNICLIYALLHRLETIG